MRPLLLRTPSWAPAARALSASVCSSITENFNASAAALTASLSSARNQEACVSAGPLRDGLRPLEYRAPELVLISYLWCFQRWLPRASSSISRSVRCAEQRQAAGGLHMTHHASSLASAGDSPNAYLSRSSLQIGLAGQIGEDKQRPKEGSARCSVDG